MSTVRVALSVALAVLALAAPAQAELIALDIETGKRTRIAKSPSDGWTSLRWTADGSALTGVANEGLDLAVRRYPADGGRARTLRRLPEAFDAILSHDGEQVAALYDGGLGGRGGVIVRDVTTGRARAKLPQAAEGDELYESTLDLVWSPDDDRIAYHAREQRRGYTLRVADARSGRVLRRLRDTKQAITTGSFSPTGDRLLYTVSGSTSRVNLLDIATGARRRLATETVSEAWAPAGERIAIGTQDGVRISGEDQRFGTTTATDEPVAGVSWSPDGHTLALFLNDFGSQETALAVMPVGGTPRIIVPASERGLYYVVWSPDGRHLAIDT